MSDSDPSALSAPDPMPASNEPIFRLPPVVVHPTPSDAEITADPWHVAKTRIADAREKFKVYGARVKVAIGDTGLDKIHCESGQLKGKVAAHYDFTGSGQWDLHSHGCIAPNDLIYTSMCGLQRIEEVFNRAGGPAHFLQDGAIIKDVSRFGIQTLSYEGVGMVRSRVQCVHKLPYKGSVLKVRTREGELTLTPWHPIYVETWHRGAEQTAKRNRAAERRVTKKRADELVVSDRIVASSAGPGVADEFLSLPIRTTWTCRHCGRIAKGGNRSQCKGCGKCRWHDGSVTETIPLNEDLAFWCGLVVSDGHVMASNSSIEFTSVNIRHIELFDSLCVKLFGKPGTHYASSNPNARRSRLDSKEAWDLIQRIGVQSGNKSRSCRVPELICKSPLSVIESFLAGVIEGDGSIDKGNGIRIATGSKKFAEDVSMLCKTLGIHASVCEVKPSKTGIAKTTKCSWCISVGAAPQILDRMVVKRPAGDKWSRPRRAVSITEIEKTEYDGFMYDLTVEGSHNYVANGMIVSNSHVAGLVLSMAPQCKLVNVKCLNNQGAGDDRWIGQSIRKAVDEGCVVFNGSFGSNQPGNYSLAALKHANENGCICVIAGGNTGQSNDVQWPARSDYCLSVSPIDENDKVAVFGSVGPEIDVAWYGVRMLSLGRNGGYAVMSGSSMSSPIFAGLVALLIEWEEANGGRKTWTVADAGAWLARCCRDAGEPGRDHSFGFGIPDVMLAFSSPLAPPDPPVTPPSDAKIITRNVWINGEPYTEITSTNYEKRVVATTP